MLGSTLCVYETPCGWCSKWDKKCDSQLKNDMCDNERERREQLRRDKILGAENMLNQFGTSVIDNKKKL